MSDTLALGALEQEFELERAQRLATERELGMRPQEAAGSLKALPTGICRSYASVVTAVWMCSVGPRSYRQRLTRAGQAWRRAGREPALKYGRGLDRCQQLAE
jgi:hypothetical protein